MAPLGGERPTNRLSKAEEKGSLASIEGALSFTNLLLRFQENDGIGKERRVGNEDFSIFSLKGGVSEIGLDDHPLETGDRDPVVPFKRTIDQNQYPGEEIGERIF